MLPIGKLFEVFAKVGYSRIDADISFSDVVFDSKENELIYGVGVGFNFGKKFTLRAEWEEYDVDTSLNSLSIGAQFNF